MKTLMALTLLLWLGTVRADVGEIPILIEIGEKKALRVKIVIHRGDLISVIGTFFGKGDEQAKAKFETLLKDSQDVTLELTTKR